MFFSAGGKDGSITYEEVKDEEGNVVEKYQVSDHFRVKMYYMQKLKRWRLGWSTTDHEYRTDPATDNWVPFHANQAQEHAVLDYFRKKDEHLTLVSTSFGAGQFIGDAYKWMGFKKPQEMALYVSGSCRLS